MAISSPSRALLQLPAFLAATGIPKLTIRAEGLAAIAQLDCVLRRCRGIRSLVCKGQYIPSCWPPSMRALQFWYPGSHRDANMTAELQRMLLVRLQDAANLSKLKLSTGLVCTWPASLGCKLPDSLQVVRIHMQVERDVVCNIDLSGFTSAAGCQADLHVHIVFDLFEEDDDEQEQIRVILSSLTALPTFSSLCLAGGAGQRPEQPLAGAAALQEFDPMDAG